MIQFELDIEHKYKDKVLGVYKLKGSNLLSVIGSNKNADINLIGEEVQGIHATIELDGNVWTINDVSGESGVWIKKEPILNFNIKSKTTVIIAGHTLTLTPNYFEQKLFSNASTSTENSNKKQYHQVVVKKFGFIIETELLKPKQSFKYKIGDKKFEFKPPESNDWKVKDFDQVSVHQRLVNSDEIADSTKDKIFTLLDPSLKIPMGVAFVFILIIASLIYFVPQSPELEQITTNPKIKKNKFTKIIYKAKTKKEKKKSAQAKKILMKGQADKATPAPAPKVNAGPSKKLAGKTGSKRKTISVSNKKRISQLLGKITKRASKNALAVESAGIAATTKKTLGPGLSTGSRIANIKPTGGGSGGKSKGISGVNTSGKAGGKGSYRGLSGFSTGSIGGSNVGIIEEETEVAGGLTKEQIARVIKRNIGQIRYCYERQLSSNPDLYGKILVNFSINAGGKINKNKIKKSTLSNSMVEGCILRKMAKWKFPKPVGGTTVKVTYPFLFKSTN